MANELIRANATQLQTALADNKPALIWVGANGESPPTDVKKALEAASKDYAGQLHVMIASVRDTPDIKEQFSVGKRAVVVGWFDGEVVSRRQRPWAGDIQSLAEQLASLVPPPLTEENDNAMNGISKKEIDMAPVTVTDATFETDVLKHDLPVLVDFWAEWCGPCKMVAPVLEKLAGEYAGKVRIAKVDVDANPGLAQAFRIMSIPTLMFIKEGKIVGQQAGALPEPVLRDALEQLIALEIPAA